MIAVGALAAVGDLTPQGCIDDNDTGADACAQDADGLNGATSVAASPDGKSVYAVSADDDAIVRFDRDTTTGALTPAGCVDDNDSGADTCGQTADGLAIAISVAVSPDGKSVYTASLGDSAIVQFQRDTTTGALTPAGCVDDNDTGPETCAETSDGLAAALSVTVSPDGKSVYAASRDDNAIARFDRNTTTGALTPQGCVEDNDTGPDACTQNTDGLRNARSVTVSPDGESLYAASNDDDAIVHLDRDTTSGALTPQGCVDDNDTGTDPSQGEDSCAQSTDGLHFVRSVTVSPDGESVYAAAASEAITRFDRNTTTGALTPQGCVQDNDTGADACAQSTDGLDGTSSVAVSPDGESVYATSFDDDAIVHFDRSASTGGLIPRGCVDDNDSGPDACAQTTDGLNSANSVASSPDGRSVYTASESDGAIARFNRADAPETQIDSGPSGTTNDPTATFTFSSDVSAVTFECRVDGAAFGGCSGPGASHTTSVLSDGSHTFEVRARNTFGTADPTAASRSFTVDTPAPPEEPPPDGGTTPDTTSPDVTLGGKKVQRLRKAVKVKAACDEECAALATGKLKIKRGGGRAATAAGAGKLKLKPARAQIEAGQTATLKLKIKRKGRKIASGALRQGKKVVAKLAVSATDAAGNKATAKRTVRLKR